MDKDYNLKDGVRVKMEQLSFIVMEKTTKEFTRR
jgi:hypothetical protein